MWKFVEIDIHGRQKLQHSAQYHFCWWRDDVGSQDISSYDMIDFTRNIPTIIVHPFQSPIFDFDTDVFPKITAIYILLRLYKLVSNS